MADPAADPTLPQIVSTIAIPAYIVPTTEGMVEIESVIVSFKINFVI